MCGLTAFLDCKNDDPSPPYSDSVACDLETAIEDGLDLIRHRGPDARGKWMSPDERVGIGHVRLSIVDPNPDGNQPFNSFEDGIHAVVNGELYEDEKHRKELESEYKFQGNSDCEIIIALYKRYGISFLPELRGEFAFVLWDEKRQLFFAGRDRYGIKSLYYTVVDGRILVATEMKCFLPFGWRPKWCLKALKECSWMFHSGTVFKDVFAVRPGHYLLSKGYAMPMESLYWDLDYGDKRKVETRSEEEIIADTRERIIDAVRLRMRADVPVAVFLSGGIDSSAIAGITAHLINEGVNSGSDKSKNVSNLKCFTVQFSKESGRDESEIARRTAEHIGADFFPIRIDEEAIASRFEDATWHSETLNPDVNGPSRLVMAQIAHTQGIKVVLTGEGADEHFGGYADFPIERIREPDLSWPASPLAEGRLTEILESTLAKIKGVEKSLWALPPPSGEQPLTGHMLNHTRIASLVGKFIRPPFSTRTRKVYASSTEAAFVEGLDGVVRDKIVNKWHPLHTAEYTWTKSILSNLILRHIGDNIDMAHQVESRPPFLDHHLTEYVNQLPPSLKIKYSPDTRKFVEKYVLRQAVRPFVTEEVYRRKKEPYLGPVHYQYNGPFHKCLMKHVTEAKVARLGFLDWREVQNIIYRAFKEHDPLSVRQAMTVAQLVILSQRFNVEPAYGMETPRRTTRDMEFPPPALL